MALPTSLEARYSLRSLAFKKLDFSRFQCTFLHSVKMWNNRIFFAIFFLSHNQICEKPSNNFFCCPFEFKFILKLVECERSLTTFISVCIIFAHLYLFLRPVFLQCIVFTIYVITSVHQFTFTAVLSHRTFSQKFWGKCWNITTVWFHPYRKHHFQSLSEHSSGVESFCWKKSCYSSKTTANSADNAGVLARSTDEPLSAKTSRPVAVLLKTPAIISPISSGKKRS